MSPAKKKTAAQKAAEKAAKAVMPTGTYDLDKIWGTKSGRGGMGTDDIDQFLNEERRRQITEIKGKQVTEIGLKMDKRIKELKKEVNSGMGSVTGVTPQELAEVTQVISQLPEAQRGIAIQALAAFRQQSGTSGGTMAPMLMLSMLQKQPQMDLVSLVTALKGLNDIQGGNKNTDNVTMMMGMFKLMTDTSNREHTTQMQMLRKEMEERNPYNPLQQTKDILEIATGMGMKAGTGEVNVELAKVQMNHETLMQKSNQDFQMLLKKMDRDDTRMEGLITMLQRPLEALAIAGSSRMTGARTSGGGVQQVPCPHPDCGYSPIHITDDAPAICPGCKREVITQAYEQKMLAQQQAEAQQQPQLQEEERKPPPRGHVQV